MTRMQSTTVRLHPADNVVVAITDLAPGSRLADEKAPCRDTVPAGHKVATEAVPRGGIIRKYGQIIGRASHDIAPGEHVHSHNMTFSDHDRQYAIGTESAPTRFIPEREQAVFQGIVRKNGRVATRNYIGVIASANCSSSVARFIADAFDREALAPYPNVDGVVSVVHGSGCGFAGHGEGFDLFRRTLAGWARHPNFAGIVLVGLGCEINQVDQFMAEMAFGPGPMFHAVNIQEAGGTRKTVQSGIAAIRAMLPEASAVTRSAVPASHLIVGLECGGSDALSGITANPALGAASDLVVRHGGTVILGETTEIYGAEQLLLQRAASGEVGQKLIDRIRWWEDYTRRNGVELDNNPSPGNKAGGLTTILEKSLGAVAKSGSTDLVEVYRFADPVTARGLVFMDTPGYDVVSVTGMIAGGANMICFTTGRGSVFGSKPVPTIKLATNTAMYRSMEEDMDINCGTIVEGEAGVDQIGQVIFQHILDTASGKLSKSERLGFGHDEFVPWQMGAIL